ncbi:MAG: T9SS type A sorting domain-containing protein, partial [Breznakibacter sp.]
FSGNGVSNMSFNPAKAGIGTHQIVYSVGSGSCKKDFTQYVTVLPAINITFNALPVICQDQEINLNGYVNIPSGTFQGAGIEGTILNTKDLEIGNYTIIYSYKDDNGCSSQASQILVIKSKDLIGSNIIFNNIEDICVSSSPINLDLYVTQKGGAFTGNGVTGKMFDPLRAGAGVHLITYTIGNGECQVILTKEVIVKQSPTIVWHDLPTLCFENEQIELNNYVSLKGGRFSGIGVENGYLKRSLISKEGIYTITYEYDTDNGCTVSVNTQINIEKATPNNIEFANPGIVCLNSSRVNLYEFVNNDNGTFSGTGVAADGLFDPLVAGIGEHRITYSFGAGKCQKQLYQYISVSASKDVTFSNPGKKCDSTPIDLTQFVNYKGGVFTGKGVEGNLFDPKISGEGIHLVSYLYKEDNCVVKVSQNIEVLNTKELIINVDRSAVESSALVRFWSEGFEISNYKWDFGDGGYSLEKEPFHYYYHTGSFDLTLICNDQNGCKHTIKKEKFITVNDYLKSERSIIEVNDPLAKVGVHYEDFPKNEYKGYPNPFTNQITIQLAGNESGVIVVYDLTGSVVHTSQFLNGEIEKTINTQNLAPGMYLVKVGNKTFKMNKK